MKKSLIENKYMKLAIFMAKKNIGSTFPNPSVGCVIVKNGVIVGVGCTSQTGVPHGEINAINDALSKGFDITGADFYVTLEPCSHHGKTGPCCEEIAKYSPKNCYIGVVDDGDHRVCGKGVEFLQNMGVNVEIGIMYDECIKLVEGFFKQKKQNKPLVTLKIASSIDGKVALNNYKSKWITNDISRKYGHILRAKNDAILCGNNTYKIDQPKLDCRINGLKEKSPDIFIYSNKNIDGKNVICGDINNSLQNLAKKGYTNVLVEGGPNLISKFIREAEFDYIYHFVAPKFIGGDGVNCIDCLDFNCMDEIINLTKIKTVTLDGDILNIYKRKI